MKRLVKTLTATALILTATTALAAPQKLVTHNTTDVESNAFIAGLVRSTHPTKAHTDGKVSWFEVKLGCVGHIVNGQCSALIKMATNTAAPVDLCWVSMDINTGIITPTPQCSGTNGYALIVNGPGESTLRKL